MQKCKQLRLVVLQIELVAWWGVKRNKLEGEGDCFYPHVHSLRGVSECDCSWTACQNCVATTAPVYLCPSVKMQAETEPPT